MYMKPPQNNLVSTNTHFLLIYKPTPFASNFKRDRNLKDVIEYALPLLLLLLLLRTYVVVRRRSMSGDGGS
jgi:hypothetical protein